ncbi:UTP--glucose-1-phosphate uridylyltransferase GalU [Paenibacillus sp. y28]|uniref:UTP--glucose-1-phosphate uridylyltransferase GalU n=1 Tax=Paenibacillus sp. y28 TaxID=3129110 RepID=UPI0030196D3D
MTNKRIRKAVIPVAGLGTRFLPATKSQPKEMLPVVDKPAIQYIVEEAVASGIESILIVTGRNKRAMEDHFDKSFELETILAEKGKTGLLEIVRSVSGMADIHYIRQKDALGLGHAILQARAFVGDEPFAVLLGDDIIQADEPFLRSMMEAYHREPASIVAVQPVPRKDVDKYGIVMPKAAGPAPQDQPYFEISSLVEKPRVAEAPSSLAVIGRYILEPTIFDVLERIPFGAGGELQLTDALQQLSGMSRLIAMPITGVRHDIGDKFGYIRANIEFALEREELKQDLRSYLRSLVQQIHTMDSASQAAPTVQGKRVRVRKTGRV